MPSKISGEVAIFSIPVIVDCILLSMSSKGNFESCLVKDSIVEGIVGIS